MCPSVKVLLQSHKTFHTVVWCNICYEETAPVEFRLYLDRALQFIHGGLSLKCTLTKCRDHELSEATRDARQPLTSVAENSA